MQQPTSARATRLRARGPRLLPGRLPGNTGRHGAGRFRARARTCQLSAPIRGGQAASRKDDLLIAGLMHRTNSLSASGLDGPVCRWCAGGGPKPITPLPSSPPPVLERRASPVFAGVTPGSDPPHPSFSTARSGARWVTPLAYVMGPQPHGSRRCA